MSTTTVFNRSYSNPISRWASVGPYYAMFPIEFSFDVIQEYTKPGQLLLDPFCGRGSSVYAAAMQDRRGIGIEINPVGWVYSQAKLNTADYESVVSRLSDIWASSDNFIEEAQSMPDFFQICFCHDVLKFLLAVRQNLNWRSESADATLMALILVYLHGKLGQALSNQMRQAKAMSPNYSVNWWKQHHPEPPQINPYDFMLQRLKWRYEKGKPPKTDSAVMLGNSVEILRELESQVQSNQYEKFSLLFTSPPYHDIANYFYDQWLRLWLLGGTGRPQSPGDKHKGRFQSKPNYIELLRTVFTSAAKLMKDDAIIYVRVGDREFTKEATLTVLRECFPDKSELIVPRPLLRRTQTTLFGDKSEKPGELDIILRPKVAVTV